MTACLILAAFLGTSASQAERGISGSTSEHGKHYCFVSGTMYMYNVHGMYGRKNNSFCLPLFIPVLVLVYLGHNFIYAK